MIRAVIFDMDGVICDTNPYHEEAFKAFFKSKGMDPREEEYLDHMFGKNNAYIMSHFFGREVEGEELKQLEDEKESLFREIYKDQLKPIDGYTKFLNALKTAGVLTAVGTSAPKANMDLIASALGLFDKMDSMLASEDVQQHKPDPEIYLKTAKRLGVEPEDCVVFEDSYSGVSAGLNAGMRVVAVLSTHTKEELPPCDLYIKDFTSLNLEKLTNILKH